MATDEVDLNDPLNWYIADSMDEYVRLDPEIAKKIIHRHNAYPKLVKALKEAMAALEGAGIASEANRLREELQKIGEL